MLTKRKEKKRKRIVERRGRGKTHRIATDEGERDENRGGNPNRRRIERSLR